MVSLEAVVGDPLHHGLLEGLPVRNLELSTGQTNCTFPYRVLEAVQPKENPGRGATGTISGTKPCGVSPPVALTVVSRILYRKIILKFRTQHRLDPLELLPAQTAVIVEFAETRE